MATTRLGQFGVGLQPYGAFEPKAEAVVVVVDSPAMSVVLAPDFAPGPPPRTGKLDYQADLDFQVLARLANVQAHLDDVQRWMDDTLGADEEYVNVFDDDTIGDTTRERPRWRSRGK